MNIWVWYIVSYWECLFLQNVPIILTQMFQKYFVVRLLLVANRHGKLAIAALKTNGRASAKTTLYQAPLMNVYASGNVCTGSAALPDECGIDQIGAWESVMFDSAFSHVNNPTTLALAKRKADKFPNETLNPLRQGIEDFIATHS
ncbi:MAG: hypothetical protein NTV43_00400 [Methylococcales bacterium]|nr:hypothetical protein [Methylococcales bacterium]